MLLCLTPRSRAPKTDIAQRATDITPLESHTLKITKGERKRESAPPSSDALAFYGSFIEDRDETVENTSLDTSLLLKLIIEFFPRR
jgi:hypothetical protein|tara:strand:- start:168 stop:425 length:258 start_codon:yes stop_codon:yes gene_type:complete